MPPRDLVAEIRAASTPAPASLRERVRLLEAPPARRRWRPSQRVLVVALPVAAAAAAAVVAVVLARPASHPAERVQILARPATPGAARTAPAQAPQAKAFGVPISPGRLQKVTATLSLTVRSQSALSAATRRAVATATSLGGHVESLGVSDGRARAVLAIPRTRVQAALTRLGRLGTIAGEHFAVQDLSGGVAATDRTIARLQRELKALRAQPSTPATQRRIAALTAQVQKLQRREAATRRASHFATVTLTLATPHAAAAAAHRHGPLHGLVVALRWTGIGLVYALAFGVPLALVWLAVRRLRRRREDALLGVG
jgi:hypothetical protein